MDDQNNSRLHIACMNGNIQMLQSLLRASSNLSPVNINMDTPLHLAIEKGHFDALKMLIEVGQVPFQGAQYKLCNPPLCTAVKVKDKKIVEYLLELGADPNAFDTLGTFGTSALHHAVGSPEILSLLLRYGADVHAVDEWYETPLHYASRSGCVDSVRIILQKERRNGFSNGDEGLAQLIEDRVSNKPVLDRLMSSVNYKGMTPFHIATESGHINCMEIMLKEGLLIDIKDNNGNTPLHLAILQNSKGTTLWLLNAKADPNIRNTEGNTPLILACLAVQQVGKANTTISSPQDTFENCEIIVDNSNGEKSVKEDTGVSKGRASDVWSKLYGASMTQKAKSEKNVKKSNEEKVQNNSDNNNNNNSNHNNNNNSNNSSKNKNKNSSESRSSTKTGNNNRRKRQRRKNKKKFEYQTELVKILLNYGANLSIMNRKGDTPLHTASRVGNQSLVLLLLSRGASLKSLNVFNRTAREEAIFAGHANLATLLKSKEKAENLKDTFGDSEKKKNYKTANIEQQRNFLLSSQPSFPSLVGSNKPSKILPVIASLTPNPQQQSHSNLYQNQNKNYSPKYVNSKQTGHNKLTPPKNKKTPQNSPPPSYRKGQFVKYSHASSSHLSSEFNNTEQSIINNEGSSLSSLSDIDESNGIDETQTSIFLSPRVPVNSSFDSLHSYINQSNILAQSKTSIDLSRSQNLKSTLGSSSTSVTNSMEVSPASSPSPPLTLEPNDLTKPLPLEIEIPLKPSPPKNKSIFPNFKRLLNRNS